MRRRYRQINKTFIKRVCVCVTSSDQAFAEMFLTFIKETLLA